MKRERPARVASTSGFTLTELMLAVLLFSLSLVMLMGGFVHVLNATASASRSAVMHRELRNGLSRMSRDILAADQVVGFGSWNSMVLRIPTPSGHYFVYYLIHNNQLYRFTSNASGSRTFGRNFHRMTVSGFDLRHQPAGSLANTVILNVRLHGRTMHRGQEINDAVETRVRMRNKSI